MLPRLPERQRDTATRLRRSLTISDARRIKAWARCSPATLRPSGIYRLREGKSASTANMAVKTLRIPLNLARRQGLILTNPAEGVELLDAESATRSTFTIAQLNDLLRHADWEWRGMMLLGATCGLRLGDAANLTWKQVDLERKAIVYVPQKSGRGKKRKPVEAIILPSLEKWLFRWPGGE